MGLVSKTVKNKWNPKNRKHYEELGYNFTKYGDEFEVKVEDLTNKSRALVNCTCDRCGKELTYKYSAYTRYNKDGKTICKNCWNRDDKVKNKILKSRNLKSLTQWFNENNLDINDYWDFEKNTINPWDISYGSRKKVWFKCQEKDYHGSYLTTCNTFINGHRCPFCNSNGGQVHPKDSLGQYIIDNYGEEFLWSIWSSKNEKSPFEYALKSMIKVWWKCSYGEHEDYLRTVNASVKSEFRCPKCVEEMNCSVIEEKTKTYLEELGYEVLTEHNCTIRPINPKTKHIMPYDNEIILENGKHLIIEVHGEQHYKPRFFIAKNKCTIEEAIHMLHYQQVKDRYKRIKCKQVGYEYLELPYWAFEGKNKNKYKELIDNKIKEILNIDKTS